MDKRPLDQKIMIAGQAEVLGLKSSELRGWSIISITDREDLPLYFPSARRVCNLGFDDVEKDDPRVGFFAARIADVNAALAFSQEVGTEPLLIHCYAGISRSTAIAWLTVYSKLAAQAGAVRQAFEIVRKIRPILQPNRHVLRLGVEALVPKSRRGKIMQQFQECLGDFNEQRFV